MADGDGRPVGGGRYAHWYRELAKWGDSHLPRTVDCDLPPPGSFECLVLGQVISYGMEFRGSGIQYLYARVRVDTTLVGAHRDTLVLGCDNGVVCAETQLAQQRTLHSYASECVLPVGRVVLSAVRTDLWAGQAEAGGAAREPSLRPLIVDRVFYLDTGASTSSTPLFRGVLKFLIPVEEVCRDGTIRADECEVELIATDLTLGPLVKRFTRYYR